MLMLSQMNQKKAVNPSQIYPDASKQAYMPRGQHLTGERAAEIAAAESQMSGMRMKPTAAKSKEVNMVGGLITLSGIVSILLNHGWLNLAFNAIYIFVGLGILTRSAMARKIVVMASGVGLVMNLFSLLAISAFLSGRASILPILSAIFSIVVQIVVLSVLTWHANEAEFH